MKQNYKIILALLVAMLAIPSFALAQEMEADEALDSETQAEVEAMNMGIGAEVRLLQLEEAISRSILKGEEIAASYSEEGADTAALSEILDQMQALLLEVQAADPQADDAVKQFVDLKSDARTLVKEFRIAVKDLRVSLTPANLQALKGKMSEIDKGNAPEISQLRENVRSRIREHNAQRLEKMQGVLGEDAPGLIAKVRAGELSAAQAKAQVGELAQDMAAEQREALETFSREENTKRVVFAKNLVEEIRGNFTGRQSERTTERIQNAEKIREEMSGSAGSRVGQMDAIREDVIPDMPKRGR